MHIEEEEEGEKQEGKWIETREEGRAGMKRSLCTIPVGATISFIVVCTQSVHILSCGVAVDNESHCQHSGFSQVLTSRTLHQAV
jgi:hypothetical protein